MTKLCSDWNNWNKNLLNSLDVDSRRCSLKFLGVREPTRDNHRANVNVIVDALNECSSSRTWEHSDIQSRSAPDRCPQTAQRPATAPDRGIPQVERPNGNPDRRSPQGSTQTRRDPSHVWSDYSTKERDPVLPTARQTRLFLKKWQTAGWRQTPAPFRRQTTAPFPAQSAGTLWLPRRPRLPRLRGLAASTSPRSRNVRSLEPALTQKTERWQK